MLWQMLQRRPFVMLDGGLATELEHRGFDLSDELWSARLLLDAPEAIARVHYDYFLSGADLAITATYQASVEGFARKGLSGPAVERLFHLAVHLAADARAAARCRLPKGRQELLVVGSVGPYGACLADGSEYRGGYGLDRRALMRFHRPRMEYLLRAGVDCLALETIPDRVEMEALCALLDEWPQARAWVSFSTRDAAHLADGSPIEEVAALAAAHPGVVAVGVNCLPPRRATPLLERLRRVSDLPLVAYPNSGEQWDASARQWCRPTMPADLAAEARQWHARGARLIGGCCRTRPADIAAMRRALETLVGHEC